MKTILLALLIFVIPFGNICTAQATAKSQKKHLLFIGEEKGYRHEAVSHAMSTIERLGKETGLWDTTLPDRHRSSHQEETRI